MERIKCAYCGEEFEIEPYLIKEHNFCCTDHYHKFAREQYDKEHTILCDNCHKPFVYRGGNHHFNRANHHYCSYECLRQSNCQYDELHNKANKRYSMWGSAKKRAKKKDLSSI